MLLNHRVVLVLAITVFFLTACQSGQPHEVQPAATPGQSSIGPASANVAASPSPVAERPVLAGQITNVSMYPVPNQRGDLAVSLVVSISNSGAPSIAKGWSLEIDSPGSDLPTGLEPVHVNGVVDMPGSSQRVDLAKEDLVLKTSQNPIGKGAQVRGILTFVLKQTSESVLASNGSGLVLHFNDALGNSYRTPRNVIGKKIAQAKP